MNPKEKLFIMSKISKKKFLFILILFLPFFLFLRYENLIQIQNYTILDIAISQIFILLIISFISFVIDIFAKNNFFNFNNLLISFSICYFISFFYEELKFKENFENIIFSGHLFSVIIFFFILVTTFFLNLYFLYKNSTKNIFLKFVSIFVFLNYTLVSFNILSFYNKNEILNFKNTSVKFNTKGSNNKNIDIYFVILDAMTSLEYAENNGIIDNKKKIIDNFKEMGGHYVSNTMANYPTTHLSIQSILSLNYPITKNSKKYSTYKNFYPSTLLNSYEDLPLTLLNKKFKRNFYWTGNTYQHCKSNSHEPKMCLSKNSFINYLNSIELFYKNNLIDFLIKRINSFSIKKSGIKSTFDILKDNELTFFQNVDFSQKNFFFMHLLRPHEPYNIDKNCNVTAYNNDYSEAYKCVLLLTEKFVKNLNILSNKPKIIIFMGDHGEILDQNYVSAKKKTSYSYQNKMDRLQIFNLIFFPNECKDDFKFAKSPVNIVRFAFNCAESVSLKYLPNKHYFTYYESHPKWGEVELILEKK
jgi:hypothetical protein